MRWMEEFWGNVMDGSVWFSMFRFLPFFEEKVNKRCEEEREGIRRKWKYGEGVNERKRVRKRESERERERERERENERIIKRQREKKKRKRVKEN